jgi:Tfp pilus assembly protein PilN
MITTNLSTRPFYNARAVRVALAACFVLLAVLTGLHFLWARSLQEREGLLTTRATQAKTQARELVEQARQLRARLDTKELEALAAAASEVNAVIEQRAFSWSRLLVHLETTLPADVRVTAVQPALEAQGIVVSLKVAARSDEDLAEFMNGLEGDGMFKDVWPVERHWRDAVMEAVVKGTLTSGAAASAGARPARGSGGSRTRDRR